MREKKIIEVRGSGSNWRGVAPGIANTMDASRFTEYEIKLAATWWEDAETAGRGCTLGKSVSQIRPPREDVMKELTEQIKKRQRAKQPNPWWASKMIERRDHFVRTAVGKLDGEDPFPHMIYIMQIASSGRRYARFLPCTRHYGAVHLHDDVDAAGHPAPDLLLPRYTAEDTYLPAQLVPLDEGTEEIWLCKGVHYQGGDIVFSEMVPIAEYIAALPPALKQDRRGEPGEDSRVPRLNKRQRDALREEFPWLRDEDFDLRAAAIQAPRRPVFEPPDPADRAVSPRGSSGDEADDAELDVDVRDIMEQIHGEPGVPVMRERDDSFGTHWYVRSRGSDETNGLLSLLEGESYGAYARSHCRQFVLLYKAPPTKTFNQAKHGTEGSFFLAREWARMLEHFFRIWCAAGSPEFLDLSGDAHLYQESGEFADWAASEVAQHISKAAIEQFRQFKLGAAA